MIRLGPPLLVMALALEAWGIGASIYGARTGKPQWVVSGRRAVYALAGLMTLCFAILEAAFLRSDFRLEVVAGHSSTTTPTFYRATAMWASQEGSLVLWVWLLSLWSSLALWLAGRRLREIAAYGQAVLLGFAAFFTGLLVFATHPFAQLHPVPAEGVGLNPLLRHPSMMVHPPMLYSGYTLFAIPFAFAVGALVAGRLDTDWIRSTRRFALLAWLCLGFGILLGARWSYAELGWGGYWAWDPVENASLMPWLTATAFLHSIQVQEKRGMLKVWNVSLVLATGVLAIMGTFLVRSGILASIHAFGASTLGKPFLGFIALLCFAAVALVVTRLDDLRSEGRLDSLVSREVVFLLNNLVLVGLCFVIFWGTFFPLISEAVTGNEASVGPPWFDRYIVPLALVLVLLSGIGPVIAWRRATAANLRRNLLRPLAFGVLVVLGLIAAGVTGSAGALAMFGLSAFVIAASGQELYRGVRARRAMSGDSVPRAVVSLVQRNRRRYGGYLVHVGVAVLFAGVAASSAFQDARDVQLGVGQTARVGGYELTYVRPTGALKAASNGRLEKIDLGAVMRVSRDGKTVGTLRTERSFFPSSDPTLGPVSRFFEGEATSEVGLRAGLRRDIWSAITPNIRDLQRRIAEGDRVFTQARGLPASQRDIALAEALDGLTRSYAANPPAATFRLIVSPLVSWIWLGALIVFAGGLIAIWPPGRRAPRPVAARYAARVARELGRA